MKNDILNWKGSNIRSLSYWIHVLAFCLVFSVGILSIFGSGDILDDGSSGDDTVWKFNLNGSMGGDSPAIGSDGTIYVGSTDYNLYAINPDGSERWHFSTGYAVSPPPGIGSDGTIYVGSSDYNLYAINPDGTEKWRYATGASISSSSPAIDSDGTIYIGSNDHNLHAVNPDGSEKWRYAASEYLHSSPAIGCDGTIYVGSHDNNLHAINPDGTAKWQYASSGIIESSPAIGSDGTIYVGSRDESLHAVNPDGTEKWQHATGGAILSSPTIDIDGTIYVGSHDNNLHAINPDGTEKWRYATAGNVESSPLIGSDGTIYVGSNERFLHAINPDGSEQQLYATSGWITTSPAIGSDGIIYAVAGSTLNAIDVTSSGLADSPWPMFNYDLKHTGKQPDSEIPSTTVATAGDRQVAISWDTVSTATSYNIYWSTSPDVTTSDSLISGVTTPYNHTELTNGTTYYYVVTAENICGESGLSNETFGTPVGDGSYSVSISPADGSVVNMCPDVTTFSANVTGGTAPLNYNWNATTTAGIELHIIGSVNEQMVDVCVDDSMTEGTLEVTVTDSIGLITADSINVSMF